jgi:hypothetical protein
MEREKEKKTQFLKKDMVVERKNIIVLLQTT